MVVETDAVQPLSSVTIKEFGPGDKLLIEGDVEYGAVPPEIDKTTDPFARPLQLTSV
jgi:hypothetical protein